MNSTTKGQQNQIVSFLRAFACIFVIMQHSLSYICRGEFDFSIEFTPNPVYEVIYYCSTKVAVPLFFIVSGYLLHRQPVIKFYIKKVNKILVPFLTFTLLRVAYSVLVTHEVHDKSSIINRLTKGLLFGDFYWFSYSLLLMMILAPLFWKTVKIKSSGREVPVIAIAVLAVFLIFNTVNKAFALVSFPNYFQVFKTIEEIPYFLFGYVVRFFIPENSMKNLSAKWYVRPLLLMGAALLCGVLYSFFRGQYLPMFVFSLLLAFITLIGCSYIKKGKLLLLIGMFTYQIYLFDSFRRVIFLVLESVFGRDIYGGPFCFVMAVLEIVIDISVFTFASWVIKKIPGLRFFFGL